MQPQIISTIITAITSLTTAFISAWVAITIKKMESGGQSNPLSKTRVFMWAIVGAVIGAITAIVILGGGAVFSQKYDDFNNPLYNNSINTNLWERIQDPNCDVKQEKKVGVFRLNNLSTESTLCYLHMPKRAEFNKVESVVSVEAMLLAEENASGDFSIGTIEFKTTGFSSDTIWLAQCGIRQSPNENQTELFFWVNNSYPSGDSEVYKTITAETNKWYKLRLEFDSYTGILWCFADDKVFGNHQPTRIDFLKSQLFSRHITSFWSAESNASFKVDDVVVKP